MCAAGFPASPADLRAKIQEGFTYYGSSSNETNSTKSLLNMCTGKSNDTAGYACKPQRILDVCQPLFERMSIARLDKEEDIFLMFKSWDSEPPPSKSKWSTLTAYEKLVASRLLSLQGGFYTEEIWNKEIGGGMYVCVVFMIFAEITILETLRN